MPSLKHLIARLVALEIVGQQRFQQDGFRVELKNIAPPSDLVHHVSQLVAGDLRIRAVFDGGGAAVVFTSALADVIGPFARRVTARLVRASRDGAANRYHLPSVAMFR